MRIENGMSWEELRNEIWAATEHETGHVEGSEDSEMHIQAELVQGGTKQVCTEAPVEKPLAAGGNIVDEVIEFVNRFVFVKSSSVSLLLALWLLGTYLHTRFDFFGYVFAYSPERQSGKSTLLKVFDLLVWNSNHIEVSTTEANLFRTAAGRTQLLDEIDTWKDKDALRSVLNSGFEQGNVVRRTEKGKDSGFKPTEYPVYGPKALAGIGIKSVDSVTLDRTFAIQMVRKKKSEPTERFRKKFVQKDAVPLAERISEWAKANEQAVARIYDAARFAYLQQFSDRTIDIAEPLAAILEVAYKGKKLEKMRAMLVDAIQTTRKEQHSNTSDHKVLRQLLAISEDQDSITGTASELSAQCANLAEPPDQYAISRILRDYGFKSKSVRVDGEARYRYVLSRKGLQDVVDRYAPEPDENAESGEVVNE